MKYAWCLVGLSLLDVLTDALRLRSNVRQANSTANAVTGGDTANHSINLSISDAANHSGEQSVASAASHSVNESRTDATAVAKNATASLASVSAAVRVPKSDRRKFDVAVFDNGLKVLAVQDPKAAKAGFAVAVSAGSFYDPVEQAGLAHFCEHLLFLGTDKYPSETSFDTYLSQHDGSNNAYTEQERTVFYNEISDSGLDEGMDRFAQFFIAPLFKANMVGRELDAVNSEHTKNMPDQGRRLWELMRSTAKNSSVISHFYTGTTESLHHGDATTIAALKKYHEENYCAHRMTLVVISKLPLQEQMRLAHKHFDGVSASNEGKCAATPRDFKDDKPFDQSGSTGRRLEIRSDSAPQLWMMFPMPTILASYRSQPASMLEYLLGYAGPKSLKSKLKATGLATDLGIQVDQSTASTLFFVTFDLTDTGVKDPDAVATTVFDYLAEVRGKSHELVASIYPTMQQMAKVTFEYQEAPDSVMDSVSGLAASMLSYRAEDVLAGDFLIDQLDVPLVEQLLQHMVPSNVNIAVASQNFDTKHANKYNKWYDVHYSDTNIAAALMERWSEKEAVNVTVTSANGTDHTVLEERDVAPKGNFQMPPPLKYVPANLEVISATAGETPKRLEESGVEVWWLGRGLFPMPKVQLRVKLAVPKDLFKAARFVALRQLHVEVVKRVLEEPMEDLAACGLDWDIKEISEGYHLGLNGYSEHASALVEQVAAGFSQEEHAVHDVEQAKEKLRASLADTTSKMPYEHAMDSMAAVTTSGVYSRNSVLLALDGIHHNEFSDYLRSLKRGGLRMQLLATGNVDEAGASVLATTLAKGLRSDKVLSKDEAAMVSVLDASRPLEVHMKNPIPGDLNSATINTYQYGVPDVAERVKVLMLGKMISQPVYDTLRTKEQLGYVVFGAMMPHISILELSVIVQGAKESPDVVDNRIEEVLSDFQSSLSNLTHSSFSAWKASLRSSINREDQNMAQEADRFWGQIVTGDECFSRKKLALEYLDSFDEPTALAAEFEKFRSKPRKVSVRLYGAAVASDKSGVNASHPSFVHTGAVLNGDGPEEKAAAEANRGFWPRAGICQIHRSQ
eukprot:TRINITY_DN8946_c0_g1_i1.p1 TRINITY_DN8946_c0_g1~~TRINITY_DN8946_c0_g1_i1.p1  ORF type:complete len:1078 (+),score=345.56 TRINITY_DN8946_c0_g1_i1:78-3311(+)